MREKQQGRQAADLGNCSEEEDVSSHRVGGLVGGVGNSFRESVKKPKTSARTSLDLWKKEIHSKRRSLYLSVEKQTG